MKLDPGSRTHVNVVEVLRLPARPEIWPEGPEITVTDGGKTANIRRSVPIEAGIVSSRWCVGKGDPVGHYILEVSVEGSPVNQFEFSVR
jgi:hypothetical protein